MGWLLVISLICAGGRECDRIVQPVETCGDPGFLLINAQMILAQAGLFDGSQKITVHCEPRKEAGK